MIFVEWADDATRVWLVLVECDELTERNDSTVAVGDSIVFLSTDVEGQS